MTNKPDKLADEYHELLFGVRRSARYHLRRRRFYECWHAVTNFIGIVTGSGAIAAVLAKQPDWAVASGIVVALSSAMDLVVGTAEMSRKHSDLASRFVLLEREIVLAGEPTIESVRVSLAKRLEIEADEPPILRALDRICYNELCRAMGYSRECYKHVPWHHRRLAHWINFEPADTKASLGNSANDRA